MAAAVKAMAGEATVLVVQVMGMQVVSVVHQEVRRVGKR